MNVTLLLRQEGFLFKINLKNALREDVHCARVELVAKATALGTRIRERILIRNHSLIGKTQVV